MPGLRAQNAELAGRIARLERLISRNGDRDLASFKDFIHSDLHGTI